MKLSHLVAYASCMLTLTLGMPARAADSGSPVGYWMNVSDKTGKAEGVIQIWEDKGEYHGKLVKLFDPKDTVCTKCEDDKKNKPLIGLEIIWGVHRDGDLWDGGKILDPDSGEIYRVKLEMADGGQKLKVRGFIGFALLGRTQTWTREQGI